MINNLSRKVLVLFVYCFITFILSLSQLFSEDISVVTETSVSTIYSQENKDYLYYDKDKKSGNFSSDLNSKISLSGSIFLKGSFYAELLLSSTLETGSINSVSFGKLYFQSFINDFIYVTAGKTEMADFTRISGSSTGIVALDFIFLNDLNFYLVGYADDAEKWEDLSTAVALKFSNGIFSYFGAVYYENFSDWVHTGDLGLIWKFISLSLNYSVKDKSDSYYFKITENKDKTETYTAEQKENSFFYDIKTGISFGFSPVSFGLSYRYNSEGFTDNEHKAFIDAVKNDSSNLKYYSHPNYDINTVYADISLPHFILSALNLAFNGDYGFERKVFNFADSLAYKINDNLYIELDHKFFYSPEESDLSLYSVTNNQITASLFFSL